MTEEQRKKCHMIIHSAAVVAAVGNGVPVPGTGVTADIFAMTTMATSLAIVFGGSIREEVAKGMAIESLKNTILKQPIKAFTKAGIKYIPILGQIVASAISGGLIEAAGWTLANDMDRKFNK